MKTLHNFHSALLLIPFSLSLIGNSQNIAINATGNQADPSAMLDVSSQTAGVLIPRMSTTARNAISSPATGLQIYNTDCNELNFWNGSCWISMGSLPDPLPITSNSSTALCAAVTATYSIPAVTGATGYNWSIPAGATINSGQGTTSVSVTLGNYSGQVCVKAYDACETSNPTCMDINVSPIPPTPGNITGLSSVAPGQTNVTYFIASVSGASGYNWSVPSGASITAGAGTPAITVSYPCNAVAGNISVTAGSNCGTSSPSSLAITVTAYLAAHAGSAVFAGATIGGSPTATGGYAPYNYSWGPNSNLSSPTVANPTALCSGSTTTYTVMVTDAGGCTATSSVVVTRSLATNAGSAIFGGSGLSGSATGGVSPYVYSWSPNNNLSGYTVSNPAALCSGSTTTYTLTVTDANGCTSPGSVTVTRNLTANAGSAVFGGAAIGGSPSATGGVSPYTYSWNPAANLSSSTASNPTATCSGSTTTYTLTVNDANGCSATNSIIVTRNLTANAGSAVFGGSALSGSATGGASPYTYSWSPASNLSSYSIANPVALCNGSTTTYTLAVTDANGCTATGSVAVTRNLAVSAGSNNSICNGGSASIGPATATGGNSSSYNYSWSPSTGLSNPAIANPTANPSSTTAYTVTVTDANGCTATSSMTFTVNSKPTASAGPNLSGVCASGSAIGGSPTATGGTAPYTYLWNPTTNLSNSTIANPTASPTSATIYTVTVTDANGCTASSSMTMSPGGSTTVPTFTYSGSSTTWTVPSGVTCISIQVWGAQGGGNGAGNNVGGEGGYATGTLTVSTGETLYIYVGQAGSWQCWNSYAGTFGGGGPSTTTNCAGVGGGASDVRVGGTALSNRVIVAGGGGGDDDGGCGFGGAGGGTNGVAGTTCTSSSLVGGGGGTQSAGGAGGTGPYNGTAGTLGLGGHAGYAPANGYGGGGGGGYYGGGGGGDDNTGSGKGGGGGGGSGYTGGVSNGTMQSGVQTGNGQVIINY